MASACTVDHVPVSSDDPEVPTAEDGDGAAHGGNTGDLADNGAVTDNTAAVADSHQGAEGDVAGEDRDQSESTEAPRCCWLNKTNCLIYSSQALSAWGDRMWTFAVALFLVELEDNSLRLTAIFGFALAISMLMFGAVVGRWVDRTPRLKATRIALLGQNSFVIVCAITLLFLIRYKNDLYEAWHPGLYLLSLLVILIGVLANLCSEAQKICIQKDWVVVIAEDDRDKLAELNAMIRRIDLSVNILALIIVGLIMNFAGITVAAVYIAAWNVGSMIAEYFLLLKVYKAVPALSRKDEQTSIAEQDEMMPHEGKQEPQDESNEACSLSPDDSASETHKEEASESNKCHFCPQSVINTYKAWKTYISYTVSWAGMGIAMFYMTVMGFDAVTSGYLYSIGVPEYIIAIMKGLSSMAGVMGTLLFPILHRRVGLERTGLYAASVVIVCLSLCVSSIWAPGSPFDPYYYQHTGYGEIVSEPSTPQNYVLVPTDKLTNGGDLALINSTLNTEIITEPTSQPFTSSVVTTPVDFVTITAKPGHKNIGGKECVDYIGVEQSYWTAVLFFGGQILQRMGLWVFDLVVTQLIQENIKEKERGVFNGVQGSLECSMNMLKFILVIFLPCPAMFGFLILLSWIFIIFGSLLFSMYSYKIRGHLFHPEKFTSICHPAHNGNMVPNEDAYNPVPV